MNRPVLYAAVFTGIASLLGCRQGQDDARPPEAETVRERALELANSPETYQPMRFVSAIEQGRPAEVEVKPVILVDPEPVESLTVTPAPMPVAEDEHAHHAAPDSAPSSEPLVVRRVPSVMLRESEPPEPVPGASHDRGRAEERGPDMGNEVGVVIRGARVDPDHCPPRRRPPASINIRIPR